MSSVRRPRRTERGRARGPGARAPDVVAVVLGDVAGGRRGRGPDARLHGASLSVFRGPMMLTVTFAPVPRPGSRASVVANSQL